MLPLLALRWCYLVFLQLDPRMARMPSTMRRPETTPPGSRLYLVAHVCNFPCISYHTYTLHLVVHGEESWSSTVSGKSELIITKDKESRSLNFLIIYASWKSMTPSFATLWCTGRTIDCGCQEGRLNKGGNLLAMDCWVVQMPCTQMSLRWVKLLLSMSNFYPNPSCGV